MTDVPFIAHEATLARAERVNQRLALLLAASLAANVATMFIKRK